MNKIQIFPDEMPQKEVSITETPPQELCFGGETHIDKHGVLAKPKAPNQKTATIGEMIQWASLANGHFKRGHKYHLINGILMDIEGLKPLSDIPWVSRNWARPAWREIQRIGILERLELLEVEKPLPIDEPRFPAFRIKQLCGLLGLGYNKINGRIVITRSPLPKATQSKDFIDMTPAERGSTSPEFALEIDKEAKLTQFV